MPVSIISEDEVNDYLKKKKKKQNSSANVLIPHNKTLAELNDDLNSSKNNINNYLNSNGVITNDNSQNFIPNRFTIRDNMRKSGDVLSQSVDFMKKENINPKSFSPLIVDKRDRENVVKFQDYIARDEGKKLVANFKNAQNERNRKRSELEMQQAEEDYNNASGLKKLWYKTGGNITRAIGNTIFQSDNIIQDKKGLYSLPNYAEAMQNKVSNSYDTEFGKLLGDVTYQVGRQAASMALNAIAPGMGTTTYFTDMYMDQYNNTI